ncbi:hypothetical protein Trydic_g7148 [Trypoxylus dichotomus]
MSATAGKCGPVTCTKIDDNNCVLTKICTLQTPDGPRDCEWICKCYAASGDCNSCRCNCECTMKTAQKVDDTYKCECSCKC